MRLLDAKEVADICNIKLSRAYSLMRNLNKEMEKKGFLVIRGRVNEKYLRERLGMEMEKNNASN